MTEKKNNTKESLFTKFMNVDVSKHTYQKPANKSGSVQLSYLSWSWAYAYMRSFDEKAKLEFIQYPEYDFQAHHVTGRKLDYMNTGNGCYVTCKITIKNETREQSLPVMDYKNQAIKNPNTMDINKAKQRCFVKCLALFGLGLSLYGMKNITQYKGSSNGNSSRQYHQSNNPQARTKAMERKPISNKQIKYMKSLAKHVDSTKLSTTAQRQSYNFAIQGDFTNANAYQGSFAINQLSKAPKKSSK